MENKERKTDSILVKVAPFEHEAIKKAAMILEMTKSEFILSTARKRVEEVLGGECFKHLHQDANGEWLFKGRRLKVFTFYYMFQSQDEFSETEWADLYDLSRAHFNEAKSLCESVEPAQYKRHTEKIDREDADLINGEPY